jgi:hypothetical protein
MGGGKLMREHTDIFTTNENTTDGEVLDRVYELIAREDLSAEDKVNFIRLSLEYAMEAN